MPDDLHILDITPAERWAWRAADVMETAIAQAVDRSGSCLVALSGGSTPAPVFDALAERDVPWELVTLLQVDERIVPRDDPARNLTKQQAAFAHLDVNWMPLPVDELLSLGDLPEIADHDDVDQDTGENSVPSQVLMVLDRFSAQLEALADRPPIIDLVHLGLGDDGHTASLVPGDPLLNELRSFVGLTGVYNGTRRISLCRPVLDRARMIVWLVSGASKADPLGRLLAGDMTIPAGLIRPAHSVVLADEAAARQV